LGEEVDQKEINKHRNDALRLSLALGEPKGALPPSVANDLRKFFEHSEVSELSPNTLRDILRRGDADITELKSIVFSHFNVE